MKIIEYEDKYLEDVKDLLVELEEYIISIDEDNLDRLDKDYRDKMALIDLKEVKENNGKCFIAVSDDKAVGLIMGCIFPYKEENHLDYSCPKKGEVTELVVSKKYRGQHLGKALLQKMEAYFKSQKCEYISLEVFSYNKKAIEFYNKNNFHNRMNKIIKKI